MKIRDFDLRSVLDFQPEAGKLLLGEDRMLLFRMDAFASLRKLLFDQLGEALSRAILSQFGYRCGYGDHEALSRAYSWDTDFDEISAGPMMHMWEGIVHVEPTSLEFNKSAGHFHMAGIWRNSYEAEIHKKELGQASHPICHSLTGYASGWCTAFFGSPLLAIETICAGMGKPPECHFEIRPPNEWGVEAEPWKQALEATGYSIVRELETKLLTIEEQQAAISALSSPVIQVWEGVLVLPVIGTVDERRAGQIMDGLLGEVQRTRARYAILDLTGVSSMDAAMAGRFLDIAGALQLLGTESIITGIGPKVAEALVSLGVDVSRVKTLATLESALSLCMRSMGYSLTRSKS